MMKRAFILPLVASMAFGLAACGNDVARINSLKQTRATLGGFFKKKSVPPTAAQIRAQLTPEVRAQLGNVPLLIATLEQSRASSVLIKQQSNGSVSTYFTPDGISVSLNGGVLVATRGLGFDLMSSDTAQSRSAILARGGQGVVRLHRYLDGENHTALRSFVCDVRRQEHGWLQETCHGDGITFENSYLLGRGGRIIKSKQWVGPRKGYITIESTDP